MLLGNSHSQKKTFYLFQKSFNIVERRGLLGKSKWVAFVNILPISGKRKNEIGLKWHQQDWNDSKNIRFSFV